MYKKVTQSKQSDTDMKNLMNLKAFRAGETKGQCGRSIIKAMRDNLSK